MTGAFEAAVLRAFGMESEGCDAVSMGVRVGVRVPGSRAGVLALVGQERMIRWTPWGSDKVRQFSVRCIGARSEGDEAVLTFEYIDARGRWSDAALGCVRR